MCVVTVGDQVHKTRKVKRTLTPVWDQQFNFEFERLTKSQLETMKISIEVIDKGLVDIFNSHLGGYEVDLTTVYFNLNHMFHKTWFTLFDFEENFEGCMGYVKATIEVLGPRDEPTIVEAITDDPSGERTVISSKIRPKGHMIIAEVYRAEYIAPIALGSRYVNPYVKVKYGGIEKSTKRLSNTANPDFNQIMFIPVMLPNHSKNVYIELYDYGVVSDTLIGSAIVPFNCFKDSDNFKPLWINIYGPPSSATGPDAHIIAVNGHKSGTTFRGRILMRFASHDENNPVGNVLPMEFRLPEVVVPNPPTKTYLLRIDLFEANELPTKNKAIFHFCVGPYLLKSSMKYIKEGESQVIWNEEIEERRLVLPMDVNQIPDFFIYFCDEDAESHRVSYARVRAAEFLSFGRPGQGNGARAKIVKFREDKTLKLLSEDAFPGFAVLRVELLAKASVPRPNRVQFVSKSTRLNKEGELMKPPEEELSDYTLYICLYVARDLLPGQEDGTSNPRVSIKVQGLTQTSKTQYYTLNPNYNEVIKFRLPRFQRNVLVSPTVIILVHHMVSDGKGERVGALLGRYWLMLKLDNEKVWVNKKEKDSLGRPISRRLYFEPPRWVPLIYDRDEKIRGRMLMGYTLTEGELDERYFSMQEQAQMQYFTIYPFGFRDILFNHQKRINRVTFSIGINNSEVEFDFMEKDVTQLFPGRQHMPIAMSYAGHKEQDLIVENLSAYFNDKIRFRCRIPSKKELCPVMEVFLYLTDDRGRKTLLGTAQYELSRVLKHYYSEAEDRDYKGQWETNFYLDKLGQKEEAKHRTTRPKPQKFQPENAIIYNDNFVFDVQFPAERKGGKGVAVGGAAGVAGAADLIEQEPENEPQVIPGREREVNMEMVKDRGQGKVFVEHHNPRAEVDFKTAEKEAIEMADQTPIFGEQEGFETSEGKAVVANKEAQPLLVKDPLLQSQGTRPIALQKNIVIEMIPTAKQIRFPEVTVSEKPPAQKIGLQLEEIMPPAHTKSGAGVEQISRIDIDPAAPIEHLSNDFSKDELEYNDVFVKENEDAIKKRQRQQEKPNLLTRLSNMNPFKGIFSRRKNRYPEYQDYDTDDEEEFDDVLPYLKGRREFQTALERSLINDQIPKTMTTIGIYRADREKANSLFAKPRKVRTKVANFKFLFIRENRSDLVPIKRIDKFLESIVQTKEFNVRVYVLKGLQITSRYDEKPKTFLKFVMNGESYTDTDSVREGLYPEYYRAKQFDRVTIPGTAMLRIEIWEKRVGFDSLLGYTNIDLEERVFSTRWQEQEKKPVEKRNIENDAYGSRGKLEMWIDVLNPKSKEPMTVIFPKLQLEYELRVIIWDTVDCVFKDTIRKSNDLYARGNVMRGDRFQESDTHWFCRNKGSFNWRWKFPISLPVDENKNYGEDRFLLQLWNRNLVTRDEMIGETEISLNTHNMLKKAHSRRKAVQMRMREKGSGSETNMFWFEVFHPAVLDKYGNKVVQGRVRASFQVMPKEESEKFVNAPGRSNPNFYPTLPQPVGRFNFNLMNPCKTLKAILGPNLCCKIICFCCLIFLLIVLIFVGYYVLTTFIGVQIALAISGVTFVSNGNGSAVLEAVQPNITSAVLHLRFG